MRTSCDFLSTFTEFRFIDSSKSYTFIHRLQKNVTLTFNFYLKSIKNTQKHDEDIQTCKKFWNTV